MGFTQFELLFGWQLGGVGGTAGSELVCGGICVRDAGKLRPLSAKTCSGAGGAKTYVQSDNSYLRIPTR